MPEETDGDCVLMKTVDGISPSPRHGASSVCGWTASNIENSCEYIE